MSIITVTEESNKEKDIESNNETESHRSFNECCLINNLLPVYTNIYISIMSIYFLGSE